MLDFYLGIKKICIIFRWWIGPWQICPVTCGELALRKRTVLCVSDRGQEMALPDSDCIDQPRPHDHEPCPDTPPCLTESMIAARYPTAPNKSSTTNKPLFQQNSPNVIKLFRPKKQEILQLSQISKPKFGRHDKWAIFPWSGCSVSCGIGFKKRTIRCTRQKCDPTTRPTSVKQCFRQCNTTDVRYKN